MSIIRNGKKIAGLYKATEVEHASEEHAGIIEIATTEEVAEGTSNSKAITPLKLKTELDKKADYTEISRVGLSNNYNDLDNKPENLVTKEELNTKQDTLIAGENITIENNVISSTGGGGTGKDEVYIQEEQPTEEGWKLWVDLDAEPKKYATEEYVNNIVGDLETILSEV